jgi:hypothetical protein
MSYFPILINTTEYGLKRWRLIKSPEDLPTRTEFKIMKTSCSIFSTASEYISPLYGDEILSEEIALQYLIESHQKLREVSIDNREQIEEILKFHVYFPGELSAGLREYSETVVIYLESGDPGGEPREFQEYMRKALAEWYDGAKVTPSAP